VWDKIKSGLVGIGAVVVGVVVFVLARGRAGNVSEYVERMRRALGSRDKRERRAAEADERATELDERADDADKRASDLYKRSDDLAERVRESTESDREFVERVREYDKDRSD